MFLLRLGFLQFLQVDLSAGVGPLGVVGNGQDVIGPVLMEGKKELLLHIRGVVTDKLPHFCKATLTLIRENNHYNDDF